MTVYTQTVNIGSSFEQTFVYTLNDQPVDLTGWGAVFRLRDESDRVISTVHYGDSGDRSLTIDGSHGTIDVTMVASATAGFAAKTGTFELEIYDLNNTGRVFRIIDGAVRYRPRGRAMLDNTVCVIRSTTNQVVVETQNISQYQRIDRGPPGAAGTAALSASIPTIDETPSAGGSTLAPKADVQYGCVTTSRHGFMRYQDKIAHDNNTTFVNTYVDAWLNVTRPFVVSGTTYQLKTTNTGAQNRAALQAAFDYLSQGGISGGTVWIGPGTFDIDDSLTRPPYVNVIGASQFYTTLRITVAKDLFRQWQPLNYGAVGGHHTVGVKFLCSALTGIRAWSASTSFNLNEYVRVDLPSPVVLQCTTAGTTGSYRPLGELMPRVRADNTMRLRGVPPGARKVWVKCELDGILGVARFRISLNGGATYGVAGNGYNGAYSASDPNTYWQPAYHPIAATYTLETGFSLEVAQATYSSTTGGPSSSGVYKPYPRVKVTGTPSATRRIDLSCSVTGQLGTLQYDALYNSGLHTPSGVSTGPQATVGGASYTATNVGGTGQNIVFYDGDYALGESALYRCPQNQFSLVEGDIIQDGTATWTVVKGPAAIDDIGSTQWTVSHCAFYDFSIGVSLCQSEGTVIDDCDFRRGNWFACVWLINDSDRYFGTTGQFTNNITITGRNIMFANGLGVCDDGGFIATFRDGNMQGADYGHWFAGRYTLSFTNYYLEGNNAQVGNSTYAGRYAAGVCSAITISECTILTSANYGFDFFYAGGAPGLETHGNTVFCLVAAYGNVDQVYRTDISQSDRAIHLSTGAPLPLTDKLGLGESRIATTGVHHYGGIEAFAPVALALGATAGVNRGVSVSATRHYITNATGAWTLGSIVPPGTTFTDGQEIEIIDTTGNVCTVTHQDTGEATAANRIICPGGVDAVIASARLRLVYVKNQSRWFLLNSGQQPGVTYTWYNKAAPGTNAATLYITLDGVQAGTTASTGQVEVGRAFVANYASFKATTAVSGATVAITVQKNGVDTAITFTIADGGTSASDTAHSVQFARGDTIGLKAIQSAIVAQAAWHGRFTVSGPAL